MTRREPGQLSLSDVLLFGREQDVGELMKPEMRRIDALLDDEVLVDQVLTALRRRRPQSARRGRPSSEERLAPPCSAVLATRRDDHH